MTTNGSRRVTPADIERIVPFEILIDRLAQDRESAWIDCRRTLHASPEPSGHEVATTRFIAARLESLRYDDGPEIHVKVPDRGTGVIADLKIGEVDDSTRVIAIRADIDALRMPDRKDVPYCSSREGLAHACGHDVHTSVVLATAELLVNLTRRLTHSELPSIHIRFLFQPAEETCEGALWIIEDGGLQNVSAILGLHVDPTIRAGRVGIRYGVLTAQVDEVLITVTGRGGHAARPQHTTDPIAASAMLISILHQSVPRHADALTPTVFTIGSIHGGTVSNVIPDRVDIAGTLRTTDADTRLRVMKMIRDACDGVAQVTGSHVEVVFRSPLGSVINDTLVTSAFEASCRQVIGDHEIVPIDKPSMGGEDFAMYVQHVRGAQIRLGCAGDADDWPLLHSPVFDIDEESIAIGVRVMTRTALLLAMIPRDPVSESDALNDEAVDSFRA
ncbi:MAG: amidohydrolase [Planctomycetaceae bacterium]|nr:amidohydrolase [Planctomycetaceae bacterium]